MKASILEKLDGLSERLEEVNSLLGDAEIISDQERFRDLSREHAGLRPLVDCYSRYHHILEEIQAAEEMLSDSDPAMKRLAEEELAAAREGKAGLEEGLKNRLIPVDPADEANL